MPAALFDSELFTVAPGAEPMPNAGRLLAPKASDGTISELGGILSVFSRDPDGMHFEVACQTTR